MRRAASLLAILLLCFAGVAIARDEVPVPPLTGRIVDLTRTLGLAESGSLAQKLAAFEERKGSQIAVLIVPTTKPEEIEQYSIRVVDQWKLGRKGVDDGALLLVAKNDHAVRIEVGYGLEGALTDATSGRIIDEIIVPQFRAGDFAGGIDAGVDAMIKVIDGEPLPAPQWRHNVARGERPQSHGISVPLLVFLSLMGGSLLRRIFGRVGGATITGSIAGLIVWLVVGSLFLGISAAIIACIVALFAGANPGLWTSGRYGGWGGGGFGRGGGQGPDMDHPFAQGQGKEAMDQLLK